MNQMLQVLKRGNTSSATAASGMAHIILSHPMVADINKKHVVQEGRTGHVNALIELQKGLTLADADDIKFFVRDQMLADPDISPVSLGIIVDNGVPDWSSKNK